MLEINEKNLECLKAINALAPVSCTTLSEVRPEIGTMETVRNRVNRLMDAGLIHSEHNTGKSPEYSVTSRGRRVLSNAALQANPVQPRTLDWHRGSYDGAELRPYTGRPGSMDAYSKPSVESGQRVERKRPVNIAAPVDMAKAGRPRVSL